MSRVDGSQALAVFERLLAEPDLGWLGLALSASAWTKQAGRHLELANSAGQSGANIASSAASGSLERSASHAVVIAVELADLARQLESTRIAMGREHRNGRAPATIWPESSDFLLVN
jgi:hypothetical protein